MDSGKPVYYIDSCVFISLIETPETEGPSKTIAALIEAARHGKVAIVASIITIAEVAFAKKELDNRVLDPEVEARIDALWHPGSMIRLVEVHELIVLRARQLLRIGAEKGWSGTRAHDAIHLATAERQKVDEFFTYDDAMRKWEPIVGFTISEPHEAVDEGSLFTDEEKAQTGAGARDAEG